MHPESIRVEARELVRSGVSLNQTSRALGVARSTIRSWLRDERPTPGCPAPLPPSPAYSALFGYYLGDGCVSVMSRAFSLRISCDASLPGIIDDVESVIRSAHPERPTYRVTAPGVIVVRATGSTGPASSPQHGPGRKHERVLGMTNWQWAIVEQHPADFLRGLFHSDGCRVNNWATRTVRGVTTRHDYPRWQFVNAYEEILGWCGDALDLAAVRWRRSGQRTISVSRRDDVRRLDDLIGLNQ